jgi:hypothetical protein
MTMEMLAAPSPGFFGDWIYGYDIQLFGAELS